jgi:hypothetical protein
VLCFTSGHTNQDGPTSSHVQVVRRLTDPEGLDNRLLYSASFSAARALLPDAVPVPTWRGSHGLRIPCNLHTYTKRTIIVRSCLRAKQKQRGKPTHAPKQGTAFCSVPRLGRQLRVLGVLRHYRARATSSTFIYLLIVVPLSFK